MKYSIRHAVGEDSVSLAVIELSTTPEFANFIFEGTHGDASVGAILSWRYRQGGVDSTDWAWIAEDADGAVIAAMGAYPVPLSRAEQGGGETEFDARNAHFASLRDMMRDDAFHIARIGVLPQARRRGVARSLVKLAEDETRKAGLPLLTLFVWADNIEATAFYHALGFTERDSISIPEIPGLERHGKMLFLGKNIS